MKILILHMRYWPDATGTGPLVTDLAQDLVETGAEVTVVCSVPHYGRSELVEGFGGRLLSRSIESGVRVIRTAAVVASPGNKIARAMDYIVYAIISACYGVFSGSYEIILCISPPITVGFSGWLVGIFKRIPLVYNVQDIWPDGLIRMGRLKNRLVVKLFVYLERFIYRVASRLIVLSEGMKSVLVTKGVPEEKIEVIPNWVDLEVIHPVDKETSIRAEAKIRDEFVILFAGNLGYAAGLDTVIDAAKILKDQDDCIFLFVGGGSCREHLEARAQEMKLANVRFLPTQPIDYLSAVLGSADVSLVTMLSDMGGLSVPSKTYAYMASARPIIAAVPEHSEIHSLVLKADCGLWIPPEDPQALAEVVSHCYSNRGSLDRFGENGREFVENHFNRKIATNQYHRVLSECFDLS
jgi:colanic acid biosynthesis glycosyl transferase WcaI